VQPAHRARTAHEAERKVTSIALLGARGFVGSAIAERLAQNPDLHVTPVTRENFEAAFEQTFDIVIHSAMPAARFKAKNDPLWDFKESVEKTARIVYSMKYKKLIHISSVSARCQTSTVYGRHKASAEALVNQATNLIVRLGPMFHPTLSKGVLIDMLEGKKVYLSGESRYAFTPLHFVADWISRHLDETGLVEVGAKNSLALRDVAKRLGRSIEFEGEVDHQEMHNANPKWSSDFPDVNTVFDFLKEQQSLRNP
jgi:nucleoside-diphosphate-sugar epimerase